MDYSVDQMLENYEHISKDSCRENLKALEDKLRELSDEVSGLNTSIREYVCDDKGRVMEDKVDKLVENMIQCYHKKNPRKIINAVNVRWLQVFLYLGLTTYKRGEITPYELYNDLCQNETFGDILNMVKSFECYTNLQQLLADELDDDIDCGGAKGVWEFFDRSYSMLTGKSVADLYPEERDAIIAERMAEYEYEQVCDGEDEEAGTFVVCEDTVDYGSEEEYEEDDIDDIYDPEYMAFEKQILQEAMIKEAEYRDHQLAENWNNWNNSLIDSQTFVDRYLEFRQLFFQTSVSYDVIRECMAEYLCSQGKCLLGDGIRMHLLIEDLDSLISSYSDK